MNNSFILNFFIKIYNLFAVAYNHSFLKKICDYIKNFLVKSSKNSFIVKFFTTKPDVNGRLQTSLFNRIISKLVNSIKNITLKSKKHLDNSVILSSINFFYKNVLNIPLFTIGVFLTAICTSNVAILILTNNISELSSLFFIITLCTGILFILLFRSAFALASSSFIFKIVFSYLGIDCSTNNIKQCKISKKTFIFIVLAGLILGFTTFYISLPFVLIGIIGIVLIGGIIYNYKIGVYLIFALLPFMPTMALVGLICISLLSLILKYLTDKDFCFKRTSLDLPIIAFAFILTFSAVTSYTPVRSLQIVLVYNVFIMSYFLITNTITSTKQIYSLLSVTLFSALIVGFYGIYQYIFGFEEGLTWIDSEMFSDIETRVVSTFENPNVLGEYLLLMIPIAFAFIWKAPKISNRFLHLILVGVLTVCMIFTYSRGNWIGLIIAVILFFAFYDRKFLWYGIIVLLLSPLFLPENIINRIMSIGNTADTSTSYRLNIWLGTLKMLNDYWITGIGLGEEAFRMIYGRYAYASINAPHPHNLYLLLITENGILGLVIFLWIIIAFYKNTISAVSYKEKSFEKSLIIGLSSAIAGFLIQGLFDNVFYNYRIVLLFFMIVGLTSATVKCYAKNQGEQKCIK